VATHPEHIVRLPISVPNDERTMVHVEATADTRTQVVQPCRTGMLVQVDIEVVWKRPDAGADYGTKPPRREAATESRQTPPREHKTPDGRARRRLWRPRPNRSPMGFPLSTYASAVAVNPTKGCADVSGRGQGKLRAQRER
jgi:hypothetical protein